MTIDLRTNLGDADYFIVSDNLQWDEEMDAMDSNESATEQNLLTGRLRGDIFIVADNEINAESAVDESPAAVEESEMEPADDPVNSQKKKASWRTRLQTTPWVKRLNQMLRMKALIPALSPLLIRATFKISYLRTPQRMRNLRKRI